MMILSTRVLHQGAGERLTNYQCALKYTTQKCELAVSFYNLMSYMTFICNGSFVATDHQNPAGSGLACDAVDY